MKNIYKTFLKSCILFLILGTSLASCEDYLDKEPDSTISGDDAFKNFMNFQGYIEEIYNCIPENRSVIGLLRGIGVTMKSSILKLMVV